MSPFKRWSLIPRCLSEGRAQWFIFQWQNDYVWLPILGCKRHLFPLCSLCWGSHCCVLRALEQPTERFRCCKWQCSGVICYDTMDNQYMVFLRLSLWYFKKIHTVYPALSLGPRVGSDFIYVIHSTTLLWAPDLICICMWNVESNCGALGGRLPPGLYPFPCVPLTVAAPPVIPHTHSPSPRNAFLFLVCWWLSSCCLYQRGVIPLVALSLLF